ncbi:Glutaredoxin, partial [Dillenia turbinata]
PPLYVIHILLRPKLVQISPSICKPKAPHFSLQFLSISKPALASTLIIVAALKKLSEAEVVYVSSESNEPATKLPSESCVYAVFDKNDELQFIGISRNIGASVTGILCWSFALPLSGVVDFDCVEWCDGGVSIEITSYIVGVVDDPDRSALTQALKSWMEQHIGATGKAPPGEHHMDRQAPRKKADIRLTPGRHVQLTVPLEEHIDRLVEENKVVAYIKGSRSAPICGFSQRVVGILENVGVDYETVNVLDKEYNYVLRETLKSCSNWPTFPQIFVNGELVGGCDILSSMYEKGEFAGLFQKR